MGSTAWPRGLPDLHGAGAGYLMSEPEKSASSPVDDTAAWTKSGATGDASPARDLTGPAREQQPLPQLGQHH